jgi:hypothetical protein
MIHVPVPPNQPRINIIIFRAHCQVEPIQLYISVKGIEKIDEVIQIISKYFKVEPEC